MLKRLNKFFDCVELLADRMSSVEKLVLKIITLALLILGGLTVLKVHP